MFLFAASDNLLVTLDEKNLEYARKWHGLLIGSESLVMDIANENSTVKEPKVSILCTDTGEAYLKAWIMTSMHERSLGIRLDDASEDMAQTFYSLNEVAITQYLSKNEVHAAKTGV